MRGRGWPGGVVLALWALSPRASATAYYVNDQSTAGDRAFPGCAVMGPGVSAAPCGTCDRPCGSPQLAYDANPVGAGDTLYLNAGRYTPRAGEPGLALVDPGKEGRPGAPLVVEGLVDASGRCAVDDAGVPLVLMDGRGVGSVGVYVTVSHVTLKGFGITDMDPSGDDPYGSGVRIRGSIGAPSAGPDGWVITGLDIYGLSGSAASPVDIDVWVPSCTGCEVSRNRLHDCPTCSAAIWLQGTPDVLIAGNEIWGNTFTGTDTPAQLLLLGAPGAVIRNNLVYANGGDALGLLGCWSEWECGTQTSSRATVINNTFWRNALVSTDGDTAEIAIKEDSDLATFRNNIVGYERGPAFYTDGTTFSSSDYNGFFALGTAELASLDGVDVRNLEQWKARGFDRNSAEADPLFVSARDFHLRSSAGWFGASRELEGAPSDSPFLDFGDPATPIGQQRAPNRGRVNLGAYGGTEEASLTPVKLAIESGNGQQARAGEAVADPLLVTVQFVDGTPAVGVAVRFEVASGDGQLSVAEVVTSDKGGAAVRLTMGTAGATKVRAWLPEALNGGEVTFEATAVGTPSDGGTDAGTGEQASLEVRCGCTTSGTPAVFVLLLLLAVARRRSRYFDFNGAPH